MEDRCVSCGAIIPEGRQVCESCEKGNRKFTDDEVIKALECCKDADCLNCPRWSEEWHSGMCADFLSDVLSIINRQKAEIEQLIEINGSLFIEGEKLFRERKTIRAEAIKEFAERLKFRVYNRYFSILIDNLAKEMTEGDTK